MKLRSSSMSEGEGAWDGSVGGWWVVGGSRVFLEIGEIEDERAREGESERG